MSFGGGSGSSGPWRGPGRGGSGMHWTQVRSGGRGPGPRGGLRVRLGAASSKPDMETARPSPPRPPAPNSVRMRSSACAGALDPGFAFDLLGHRVRSQGSECAGHVRIRTLARWMNVHFRSRKDVSWIPQLRAVLLACGQPASGTVFPLRLPIGLCACARYFYDVEYSGSVWL